MKNFARSASHALNGIKYCVSRERNIRIQIAVAVIVVTASIILQIPRTHFIIILAICFLVVGLEFLNTALEKLIDILSPRYHKQFGIIKDITAGLVLLTAIASAIIGILILYPPIAELIGMLV